MAASSFTFVTARMFTFITCLSRLCAVRESVVVQASRLHGAAGTAAPQ
jgi:hypothetical protein